MRSVADKYDIDPNRIGITGGSAGGHLSLMVGLVGEDAGLEGTGGHAEYSSRVQCVVNYCGPTDLVHEYEQVEVVQPFLVALCGGTPETAADAYRAGSPISFLSTDDPPVLTLHGDLDELVPVAQARLLDQKMKAAGLQHELLVLEGQGHAIKSEQADVAFWRFFETHLKGK
jgi:dipeptidyl aminopeptidase/acylaminoacyl peptidase